MVVSRVTRTSARTCARTHECAPHMCPAPGFMRVRTRLRQISKVTPLLPRPCVHVQLRERLPVVGDGG
eukprot:6943543-Prymnesium_polylepis.1